MRFVSQYSGFQIQLLAPQVALGVLGQQVMVEGIEAQFSEHDWSQRDLDVARLGFKWKGLYQYEDEATPVEPTYRLSVYDTEVEQERLGWSDEIRAEVERRLRASKSFGTAYIVVPEIALDPPWPTYDLFVFNDPEELVARLDDLGFPLEPTLAYEQSKWGQRRDEVIAAFQRAISERTADEIVVE